MNYWFIPTLLLALILFGIGALLASKLESRLSFWLLTIVGVLTSVPAVVFAIYYLRVFNEPLWLYGFRSWPCSELAASGAGFLAGLLHGRYSSKQRFRRIAGRWFFPGTLILGLLVPYAKPILRPPRWGEFQDRWSEGVCLQTSESSCGPACAATLLRQLGKPATEKELARASYTSRSGTENWYLARTLRQRGIQVRFCVNRDPKDPLPIP
jgi:Peptidase C39 family